MFHSVRTRVIAAFAAVLAVAVAIAVVGGAAYVRWQVHGLSDDWGLSAARGGAAIGEFVLDGWNGTDPDPQDYEQDRLAFRSVCREAGMDYLYLIRCDVANGTITYLMCVADDDGNDERIARERGYGAVVHSEIPDNMRRAMAGEDVLQALVLDNQFGNMLAWFSVVPGTDGQVLAGAEFSVSEQRYRVFLISTLVLVPLVAALLVVMAVQLRVLQKHVFNPIGAIAERMRAFSPERASDFEPLKIESRDEMGEIADAFDGMATDIAAYASDIERLTAERVQADVELDVARRIQLGMVPERSELAGTGFQACSFSRAARSVGGDFYDVFELEGGRVAVVVGDVSGKGVAAALFMAMVKTMVHEGLSSEVSPATALNRVNDRLCASNPEGMFATVFACVLDPATGEVRYANAGHVPPLLVGDDAQAIETRPGMLLGLFEDAGLEDGALALGEGECLLVFTDGATEAVNAERKFFGAAALAGCMSEHVPYRDAGVVVDAVIAAVDGYAAGCEQFDDLTVVALLRVARDAAKDGLCELPVGIASFSVVRDAILGESTDEAAGRKACLACEEAFANIVSHSGATHVWFAVARDGDCLQVTLADDGVPFDPLATAPADRAFDDLEAGGMGLGLIRSLSTHAAYTRTTTLNVLVLAFR